MSTNTASGKNTGSSETQASLSSLGQDIHLTQTQLKTAQSQLGQIDHEFAELLARKNNLMTQLAQIEKIGQQISVDFLKMQKSAALFEKKEITPPVMTSETQSKFNARVEFLRKLDEVIAWRELTTLLLAKPSSGLEKIAQNKIELMLRLYLLQQWFGLSSSALAQSVFDSISMREFVRAEQIADPSQDLLALNQFKKTLETHQLNALIDTKIKGYLKQNGLALNPGDASQPLKTNDPSLSKVQVQSTAQQVTTVQSNVQKSNNTVKKNKYAFSDFLATYAEPKKLITEILTKFHELVVEKKETRHYLFNVSVESLISDQLYFSAFVFPKAKITHNNPIVQTAPASMRVAINTFDEIASMLEFLLVDAFKFDRKTAPTAAAHILELVEETRCQIEDTNQTVWKPIELKAELIESFFSMRGVISRSLSPTQVALVGGLEFPLQILIDRVNRLLTLKATCYANDWAGSHELRPLTSLLNENVQALNFEYTSVEAKQALVTEYHLPYGRGVPNRLLFKASKSFAATIAAALAMDDSDLMIKPST